MHSLTNVSSNSISTGGISETAVRFGTFSTTSVGSGGNCNKCRAGSIFSDLYRNIIFSIKKSVNVELDSNQLKNNAQCV